MSRSGAVTHPLYGITVFGDVDQVSRMIAREVSRNVDRVFEAGEFSMEDLDRALVIYAAWLDWITD